MFEMPARTSYRGSAGPYPVLWNYTQESDNHVDPKSFLERLTVGSPSVKSWRGTVLGALHVSNHVCLVAGLVGTWVSFATEASDAGDGTENVENREDVESPGHQGVDTGWWQVALVYGLDRKALTLFAFEAASFLFTLLLYYRKTSRLSSKLLVSHVRQAAVLLATVVVLSPIYATLTTSISSDTTIALIVVLMIAHLYLYDYREMGATGTSASTSTRSTTYATSLMCGMSASVLASTTMHSIVDVIGVTLLALQLYVGSPYFLHGMYGALGKVWSSVLVTVCVLVGLPLVLKVWLSALLVVIVMLCPMWMLRIDKFKSHISGPWDEVAPSFDVDGSPLRTPRRQGLSRERTNDIEGRKER